MGYRHYIGYIPKEKFEELKNKYPNVEGYEIQKIFRDNTINIYECGKLYYKNTEPIYDCIYNHKDWEIKDDDTEFFTLKSNKFLYELSRATYQCWINYLKSDSPDKIIQFEIDAFEKNNIYYLNKYQFNYCALELFELHRKFDYEHNVLVCFAY